jgi:hypothetical protein
VRDVSLHAGSQDATEACDITLYDDVAGPPLGAEPPLEERAEFAVMSSGERDADRDEFTGIEFYND